MPLYYFEKTDHSGTYQPRTEYRDHAPSERPPKNGKRGIRRVREVDPSYVFDKATLSELTTIYGTPPETPTPLAEITFDAIIAFHVILKESDYDWHHRTIESLENARDRMSEMDAH